MPHAKNFEHVARYSQRIRHHLELDEGVFAEMMRSLTRETTNLLEHASSDFDDTRSALQLRQWMSPTRRLGPSHLNRNNSPLPRLDRTKKSIQLLGVGYFSILYYTGKEPFLVGNGEIKTEP